LGEVENAFRGVAGVKEAVVVAWEDGTGGKYLCGYYVGKAAVEQIRKNISKTLPGYMMPAHFVRLESLPLTANGKINREALPEPEMGEARKYVAPRDEVEAELCAMFAEVLGMVRVGIEDGFFSSGGHSLRAVKLTSMLRRHFGVPFGITDLLEASTVAQVASIIEKRKRVSGDQANTVWTIEV
jgi:acyl carrier protein